jgi:hypothetical protein
MDSDEKVSWKSSCMESVGSQLRPQPLRPCPCFRLYTRAKDGTTIDLTGAMLISKLYLLLNPILHTAWLDNHALTLKSNSVKYYFHEKSRFPKILL